MIDYKFFQHFPGRKWVFDKRFILATLVIAGTIIGLQKFSGGHKHYENYLIFKNAWLNLYHGNELYASWTHEYLYSPSFAVFIAPFAILPDLPGIIAWCLFNSLAVYLAIKSFPGLGIRQEVAFTGIIFFDFITSQQNLQTNTLIAALIVLAFVAFEKDKPVMAALCILLTFYIKIYGIVVASLFLLYPRKGKFIAACFIWAIVLFLLPMLFISGSQLISHYHSWIGFTQEQYNNASSGFSASLNSDDPSMSMMSMLHAWFGINWPSLCFQLGGGLLFMLPFVRLKQYNSKRFRELLLASALIFCVIFNHMAESCSFVVAVFGVAIWFIPVEKNYKNIFLFVMLFILTSISPTYFFPRFLREWLVKPYVLKALPCVLIWFEIQYELLVLKFESRQIIDK